MHDLAEHASRCGVEIGYVDAIGRDQTADPEAVRRILAALDCHAPALGPDNRHRAGPVGRAFQGDEARRHWLLAVQLYAARSASNWGHGDFRDLAALVRLAAEVGAAGIGLNPLHALFPERPEHASPYSPNSRLFLNPLYIDVEAAPGFPGMDALRLADEVEVLRRARLVDYPGVARAKLRALRESYRHFRARSGGDADFAAFRAERGPSLQRFAVFETLRQKYPVVWWQWPDKWRTPTDTALKAARTSDPEEVGFHEYMQWVADRQLAACQALARQSGCALGLYVDLAVGVEPGGADAWAGQGTFLRDISIGAPPDILNTAGQDWGLTTFNPHRLLEQELEPFRGLLDATMRHAGAVRLDHILGLQRVFIIPHGMSPRQGTYLRFPFDVMLRTVVEASQRNSCIVIGEDLGTVPQGFRQVLAECGIWRYLVMLFEREHDGRFQPPEHYPASALATFTTHDLATFAGWCSGHDLRVKRSIEIDPGETDEERARTHSALREAVARYRHGDDEFVAVIRHLADTPSRLVAVAAEDIWNVLDQVNIPGTVQQHPNWRHRLPLAIEDMGADARLWQIVEAFKDAGR
jgi:4-alpha-glucanotransferase